ncbi:MAG: CARDB domain-containing protein [Methanomicrobiaceae archaeon]|nr:CARDB domain-containing protein [Methanomicrobiaceae archaeon]
MQGRILVLAGGLAAGNGAADLAESRDPARIDTPVDDRLSVGPETPEGPDFAVANLRVPASVPEQSPYEVLFDVENLGDSYEGDIRWEVWYRGAVLDAFEYGSIQGLDRGRIESITVEMMADVLVDARDEGMVTVIVDPGESTGDIEYANNIAQEACVIVGMPEFSLSGLSVPAEVYEGGSVNINFTISNYGAVCEGDIGWEVAIRSNNFSRDDVVLAGAVRGLGEGEHESVTAVWKTHMGDAGQYVVYALITTPDDEFDDNEGLCELMVMAGGDPSGGVPADSRIPETSKPETTAPPVSEGCTICAADGESRSGAEQSDPEDSGDGNDSSAVGTSPEMASSRKPGGISVQDSGGNGDDAPSVVRSRPVEASISANRSTMSGMESRLDGEDNITRELRDPGSTISSNASVSAHNATGVPCDDVWAAMWNALVEGDIRSFLSELYEYLMKGTVSCVAPGGAIAG